MSQTLRIYYKEKVIALLLEQFKYQNIHEVPKITKITINRGLGEASKNNKELLKFGIKSLLVIELKKPKKLYAIISLLQWLKKSDELFIDNSSML
jgi:large subunit ribosomal protein L5